MGVSIERVTSKSVVWRKTEAEDGRGWTKAGWLVSKCRVKFAGPRLSREAGEAYKIEGRGTGVCVSTWNESWIDEELQPGGANSLDQRINLEARARGKLVDFQFVEWCEGVAECDLANAIGVWERVCVVSAHQPKSPFH